MQYCFSFIIILFLSGATTAQIAPRANSSAAAVPRPTGVTSNSTSNCNAPFPIPANASSSALQVFSISANNITASFIPYGARLTSLLVPDRSGQAQDVVVGFDNPSDYVANTLSNNAYIGPVVGRYANRIKNGTFTLDGTNYRIPSNEFNKTQTLHGGPVGYDQRNWTITRHTTDSITFSLFDNGFEDFPGDVINFATFTVNSSFGTNASDPKVQLTTTTVSIALTVRTPIMLSNHIYWNLNGFKRSDILNDTLLQLPLSKRFIPTDSHLIPTGNIGDVKSANRGAFDFTSPKLVGKDIQSADTGCGNACPGYDTCFIIDRQTNNSDWTSSPAAVVPAVNMTSTTTGISMLVSTNQQAVQIYSCSAQNGTMPVKQSQVQRNQQGGNATQSVDKVQKYGCLVIEPEGWIDGINFPQWGQIPFQVFGPGSAPAVNWATYVFDTV